MEGLLELFHRTIRLSPSYAKAHVGIGVIYSDVGVKGAAVWALTRAASLGYRPAQNVLHESGYVW